MEINELTEKFLWRNKKRQTKIAVIGDAMIDEYFYVDASRVSPEFPVPVMRSDWDSPALTVPAGAGNVAMQFQHWNVDLQLFGLLDKPTSDLLLENNINIVDCVFPGNYLATQDFHCPIKRRYYQGQFPLCRWDVEAVNYGVADLELHQAKLCEAYRATKPEVAVFSDYNKGLFGKKVAQWFAEEGDTITIVDPKKGPIDKWRGCTIFKPNQKEAEELSGAKDWKNQCNFFQRAIGCMAVVITQSGEGVVGKVMDKFFEYRPAQYKPCQSVIGAGDCFSAFLAMTMAHNFDIVDAVKIAWEAAAVYVQSRHNQPVTAHDLQKHIDPIKAKYVVPEFLTDRPKDHKLIFTNGCFDLIHEGHIRLLQQAKKLGTHLVVALNTDSSTSRLKGLARPIQDLQERSAIISGLECVDYVVSFDEDTPAEVLNIIKPNVIVKGGDYKPEEVVGHELAEVAIIALMPGKSTTAKINKINAIDPK